MFSSVFWNRLYRNSVILSLNVWRSFAVSVWACRFLFFGRLLTPNSSHWIALEVFRWPVSSLMSVGTSPFSKGVVIPTPLTGLSVLCFASPQLFCSHQWALLKSLTLSPSPPPPSGSRWFSVSMSISVLFVRLCHALDSTYKRDHKGCSSQIFMSSFPQT